MVYCEHATPSPRDAGASGLSLVLRRAAADTRGQHGALHCAGAAGMHGGKEGRRENDVKRKETKGLARTAGDKATGAWRIGGRGGRRQRGA